MRIGVGRRSMVCISARCLCWISLRQIPGVHRCRWQTICVSARPPLRSTKRLQKAGYLTKEVDAENLRCKRLYISEEGQRACAMCRERLDQIDAVAFQGFSEEELEVFSSFLDRVTLNMTGESENVVSGELFGHLCRELDAIEKEAKKS